MVNGSGDSGRDRPRRVSDDERIQIDSAIDDETLAEFLDGTLSQERRRVVLRELATNPQRYADLLAVAPIAAEARTAEDLTLGPRAAGRSWLDVAKIAVPLLAAACIAAVVALPRGGAHTADIVALMQRERITTVTGAGALERALGPGWDEPGWSTFRGTGSGGGSSGVAVRLGARFAQLEFAASAHDSLATTTTVARLTGLLGELSGAGPVTAKLHTTAAMENASRAALGRQMRELTVLPAAFDAGAWLETARLATLSDDTQFFARDGDGIAILQAIVRALNRNPPTAEWPEIAARLTRIVVIPPTDLTAIRAHIDSVTDLLPR
jgi:hypothetical protein